MSESCAPLPNGESKADLPQEPCCAMTGPCKEAALRAAIYVPALLLTSAFAAAAVFPGLAEYATPLIDIGVQRVVPLGASSSNSEPCCQQASQNSGCSANPSADVNSPSDAVPADALAAVNAIVVETAVH